MQCNVIKTRKAIRGQTVLMDQSVTFARRNQSDLRAFSCHMGPVAIFPLHKTADALLFLFFFRHRHLDATTRHDTTGDMARFFL